jgi:hypothetical protein
VHVGTLDGSGREGILIGAVGDGDTVSRLRAFTEAVARFKELARQGKLLNSTFRKHMKNVDSYTKEFTGEKSGRRSSAFKYVTYHGDVVEALRKEAIAQGFRAVNKPEDLSVWRGNQVVNLYEVKTDTDSQTMFTAIGQLLVYARARGKKKPVSLTLVIPAAAPPLKRPIKACLHALGITVRHFQLHERRVLLQRVVAA